MIYASRESAFSAFSDRLSRTLSLSSAVTPPTRRESMTSAITSIVSVSSTPNSDTKKRPASNYSRESLSWTRICGRQFWTGKMLRFRRDKHSRCSWRMDGKHVRNQSLSRILHSWWSWNSKDSGPLFRLSLDGLLIWRLTSLVCAKDLMSVWLPLLRLLMMVKSAPCLIKLSATFMAPSRSSFKTLLLSNRALQARSLFSRSVPTSTWDAMYSSHTHCSCWSKSTVMQSRSEMLLKTGLLQVSNRRTRSHLPWLRASNSLSRTMLTTLTILRLAQLT